jgi:polyvinyl alcohol dehydrogenase (cytochrome)
VPIARRGLGVVVAALLVAACTGGDPVDKTALGSSPAGSSSAAAGSHADSPGAEWSVYGHDPSNTRTNASGTTITAANVATLTKSWEKDGLVGVSGTPAVVAGVAYFGDWNGTAWAVRADTGEELWHTPVPGGFIVAAPAVASDAVFIANGHTLYRLALSTGAIEWQAVTNESPLAQINASPVVVDDLVIQGTASIQDAVGAADQIFRGSIGAYDVATGKEVWRFYATTGDTTSGSGVGIWSTPAVDTTRGMLYVGTGNTSSEPSGPLADSLLAIDYKTGTLKWSTQFTPIDVFPNGNPVGKDVDVGASPNLWTSDGRDFVGVGDKGGVYHALDRETGDIVWQTPLTPGGFFGGVIGSASFVDGELVMSSNGGDLQTGTPPNVARVFALDPATGAIKWRAGDFAGMIFAPISSVPGVAFVGTDQGILAALDTSSGKQLWTFTAPNKTGCGPAIVGNRVVWGYGFFLFGGAGAGGVLSFTVVP